MTVSVSVNRDALVVGGRVFVDLNNIVILHSQVSGNTYTTFEDEDNNQYQVATGSTYRVWACKINGQQSSLTTMAIGYGDDAVTNSAAAPTNRINYAVTSTDRPFHISDASAAVGATGLLEHEYPIKFDVPATKYPVLIAGVSGSSVSALIYGYII